MTAGGLGGRENCEKGGREGQKERREKSEGRGDRLSVVGCDDTPFAMLE